MGENCFIEVTKNNLNFPIFETTFGSKKLKVSIPDTNFITLNDGQFLNGFCATTFSPFSHYSPLKESGDYDQTEYPPLDKIIVKNADYISLHCVDRAVYVFVVGASGYIRLDEDTIFSCRDYKYSVYETTLPYDWCTPKATSYMLVLEIMKVKVQLASVCYNFDNLSLESIRYMVKGDDLILSQERLRTLDLPTFNVELKNDEVNHYGLSVINDNLRRANNFGYAHNSLFKVAVYKRGLIIQDGPLVDFFLKYGKFLEVILWHNLVHGNWKRFTTAFRQQGNNLTYEVFTGTSGTIKVPYFNICKKWDMQRIADEMHDERIPTYIWAYLREYNDSEEFVVIGFNSPFFEFFDIKEVIFCRDMCNEIPWLSNISSTFRYSALGIVFCCTPDDVLNAGVLKGFPKMNKTLDVSTDVFTKNYSENAIVSSEDN